MNNKTMPLWLTTMLRTYIMNYPRHTFDQVQMITSFCGHYLLHKSKLPLLLYEL